MNFGKLDVIVIVAAALGITFGVASVVSTFAYAAFATRWWAPLLEIGDIRGAVLFLIHIAGFASLYVSVLSSYYLWIEKD